MTATTFSLPSSQNIQRSVLDNGAVVLVYSNPHVESVLVQGSFFGGAVFEDEDKRGLASLTASMLMRGTHGRDFDAIHSALEDIGADFSFGSGTFTTSWNGKALAEDFDVLVNTLGECLRQPAFPEAMLDVLRQQRLTDMRYRAQDTRYRAGRTFREALYAPHHPYHHSIAGTPETLANISVGDLHDFHARYYGANAMLITVVGNIDAQEATERIAQAIGDWHNPQQPDVPTMPDAPQPTHTQRLMTTLEGKTQNDIVLGCIGPARRDPDYLPATLANSVLGQFGMMGRIGHSIREQSGLAYYAYSNLEGGLARGMWSVMMGVDPQDVDQAIDQARAELKRMVDEPISAEELADNQSFFKGRLPLRLSNNAGIANTIMTMERYGLGLDYLLGYNERIDAVTVEQVQDAVSAYINPDALIISVAGV